MISVCSSQCCCKSRSISSTGEEQSPPIMQLIVCYKRVHGGVWFWFFVFLPAPKKCHRNLKQFNCLGNQQGQGRELRDLEQKKKETHQPTITCYWSHPVLVTSRRAQRQKSQRGDCYCSTSICYLDDLMPTGLASIYENTRRVISSLPPPHSNSSK